MDCRESERRARRRGACPALKQTLSKNLMNLIQAKNSILHCAASKHRSMYGTKWGKVLYKKVQGILSTSWLKTGSQI